MPKPTLKKKTHPPKARSRKAAGKTTVAKAGKSAAGRGGFTPPTPQRVQAILQRLDELYPGVTCALTHTSPWELLVATILSAQCTDVRVNEVTPGLFKKYPTPEDFAAVSQDELANDIRSTGFFNNKAKSIVGAANRIMSEF